MPNPSSNTDFMRLALASGLIVPLLERIKRTLDVYRLSSNGDYDVLKAANLPELEKLLSTLEAFGRE